VLKKRDLTATRRFFTRALGHGSRPSEVNTDRAPAYPRVLDGLLPSACHVVEQHRNNPIESDHGPLKFRLRPMRGLTRLRSARVISAGHACVQNIRPGHHTQHGTPPTPAAPSGLRRTRLRHLTGAPPRSAVPASHQRNNTRATSTLTRGGNAARTLASFLIQSVP